MVKHRLVVAALVLWSAYGCSADSEEPEREQTAQSANRTVAYLTDAQEADLLEEVRGFELGVPLDAARVAEAMRSTCVAMLDEVPHLDRAAASHLTAGLQTDLGEGTVRALMEVAAAQEWCRP